MKFDNPKRLILALFMACMSVLFAEVLHGQNLDEDLLKALARPVEAKSATEEKAAEPTVSKFEPYRTGGGHLVEIGPYRVDNLWQGQERKGVVADDWRYFMHGMKDAASYPLAWDEFIDEDQEKYLDKATVLQTPVKFSNVPPIVLNGGESLIPAKPLVSLAKLAAFRGSTLRFYIWIKGEGTGLRTSLWEGAPWLCFYLKDSQGTLVGSYPSAFCTRGTFPWFCYQIAVDIPYTLATAGGTIEAIAKMVGVIDVDRTAQAATVVGGAAAPVEADVIGQKYRDGAEVDLSETRCIELETVPKHEGVASRRTTERSRGSTAWTVCLNKNGTMLDEQVGKVGRAFGLQHQCVKLLRHQGLQRLDVVLLCRNLNGLQQNRILGMKPQRHHTYAQK